MANHLTPEELSKELGIDRAGGHPRLRRGGRADLPGQDRQDAVPGAAPGASERPAAGSTSAGQARLRAARRRARALSRGLLLRGLRAFSSFAPRRRSRAAPPSGRRPASRRPAPARVISSPVELRLEHRAQLAAVLVLEVLAASNSPTRLADHLLRELELGILHLGLARPPPRSRPASGRPRRRRASRARACRPAGGSGRGSPCPRARTCRSRPCPSPSSPRAAARRDAAAPAAPRARGSRCGRRRPGRPRRAGRSGGCRSTASAAAPTASRSDVLDDHELALRELPALDELVGLDVALVRSGTSASA